MQRPSDHRHELVADFMRSPIDRHGAELQALLNTLRDEPLAGKTVLVCVTPHREWRLARLPGERGAAVEILDEPVFTSIEEAERHVFRLRWKRMTGTDAGAG